MKNPMTLIREREVEHPPLSNDIRLYTYVRPLKNGHATIEVWGTRNHKGRKGNPLVGKCFYKMRTDTMKLKCRDVLWYSSWSCAAHDHVCYSFPEGGGTDYYEAAYRRTGGFIRECRGKWGMVDMDDNSELIPTFVPMLNGWEGTKFKYCGFNPNCGMFVLDYLALWEKHPKAEILSKMGCFYLLTDEFLRRLDKDKPFAKYVAKFNHAIRQHNFTPTTLFALYERGSDLNRMTEEMNEMRRRDMARAKSKTYARYLKYDRAINALYHSIKEICGTYGAYEVIVPANSTEMLDEGERMHNCIGKCYAPKQGKKDICLFLHRNGKPCVDIRIDLKTFKLMECRAVCNKNAPEDAWDVAKHMAELVRERLAA